MSVYGIVETFDDKLGYGSIKEFDGGDIYLVHRSEVKTLHTLEKGYIVLFDKIVDDGIKKAKYVKVVDIK